MVNQHFFKIPIGSLGSTNLNVVLVCLQSSLNQENAISQEHETTLVDFAVNYLFTDFALFFPPCLNNRSTWSQGETLTLHMCV